MSRKFKTGKRNRESYKYYDAFGNEVCVITSADCDEVVIKPLHESDDYEFNLNRRDKDRGHIHIEENIDDYINYSINLHELNPLGDPLRIVIRSETNKEIQEAIDSLLPAQRDLLKKKFIDEKNNTEIAIEAGVSEAAIRNRNYSI